MQSVRLAALGRTVKLGDYFDYQTDDIVPDRQVRGNSFHAIPSRCAFLGKLLFYFFGYLLFVFKL
jgi:hypothetical protein